MSKISIHAPTRGATYCIEFYNYDTGISIHAPTRGATIVHTAKVHCSYNFNPRSHEGSDITALHTGEESQNFNPRSHEGSDSIFLTSPVLPRSISIHAPTRGATTFFNVFHCYKSRFQSTLPRGERQEWWRARPMTEDISIHASTRGATATLTNFFFYNQSIFC